MSPSMNPVLRMSAIRPSMITLVSRILGEAELLFPFPFTAGSFCVRPTSQEGLTSSPLFFRGMLTPSEPKKKYSKVDRIVLM